MNSYYIKVTITTEMEVIDCETLEDAKAYVLEQVSDNRHFDFEDIKIEEVEK